MSFNFREIDAGPWLGMVRELGKLSGRDFDDVLVPQVGALLKACITRTPARRIGEIIRRASDGGSHIQFADGTVVATWKREPGSPEMFLDDSNWNGRGKAPRLINGKSWHDMTKRHWSDQRWGKFQAYDAQATVLWKKKIEAKVAARGLAKKTWFQIAQDLGLEMSLAPAYVRNAKSPDGKPHIEGFARRLLEAAASIIEIENANPLVVRKLNGAAILEGAMLDRQKAFARDLDLGVFDDVKRRAQRYPGIFVNH